MRAPHRLLLRLHRSDGRKGYPSLPALPALPSRGKPHQPAGHGNGRLVCRYSSCGIYPGRSGCQESGHRRRGRGKSPLQGRRPYSADTLYSVPFDTKAEAAISVFQANGTTDRKEGSPLGKSLCESQAHRVWKNYPYRARNLVHSLTSLQTFRAKGPRIFCKGKGKQSTAAASLLKSSIPSNTIVVSSGEENVLWKMHGDGMGIFSGIGRNFGSGSCPL